MLLLALGHDIVAMKADTKWGSKFFKTLSIDLKKIMPEVTCFSPTNLLYMKNFYLLYQPLEENDLLKVEDYWDDKIAQQVVE